MRGEHRHGHRRAHAVGGDEHVERQPLVALEEAVQRLGVLTDVVMDVEERRGARLQLGQRARRDGDEVADAADLEQHRCVLGALQHGAAQRADHRRASATRRRIGAMARWHRASAAASAASGGDGGVGQPEAHLDHLLHLGLARRAVAGDGILHLVRRVLDDLAPGRRSLGERQPAGLPDAHRRAHVDLEEHLLDGDAVGTVLGDQRGELALQEGEPLRQRVGRRGADHAEGSGLHLGTGGVQHGVPAAGEPGVDAQHRRVGEHAYAR